MRKEKGATLIVAMILLMVLTLLGVATMNTTLLEEKMAKNMQDAYVAFNNAETGLSEARAALNNDPTGTRDDLENGIDISDTDTIANNGSFEYTISNLIDATATLKRAIIEANGTSASGTQRTVYSFAKFLNSPTGGNAALELYDTGFVTLKGTPDIDGHDHDVPTNFNCSGASCNGMTAIPGDDVVGVYSEDNLDELNLIGTPTIDGNPAQQTGGGGFSADFWEQYAIDAENYASAWNGSDWGTRDNPVVHVVNQDMAMLGSLDGAGILIVKDAALTFGGNFHFEGRVIVLSTGDRASITMGGTSRIFGSIVVIGPNTTIDFGSAGTPELVFSSEALSNIVNTIQWKTAGWFEEAR